jgi:predicted transcriptional regulator
MFNSPTLGPLEKEVMEIVWKKNVVSVKQVIAELSATHKLAYTTVLTILSRLWKKGLLDREKSGKSFVYKPKNDKQQTVNSMIRSTLQALVERYGDEAISAFIDEVNSIEKEKKSK